MTTHSLPSYRDRVSVDQRFAHERAHRSYARSSEVLPSDERWVQLELPFYEETFTTLEGLHICVTTFNVGCKKPPPDLSPLLVSKHPNGKPMDLIVIGFQEVDMSPTAMWKEETEAATPWVSNLMSELGADPVVASSQPPLVSPSSPGMGGNQWTSPTGTTGNVSNAGNGGGGISASSSPQSASTSPYVMLPHRQLVGLLLCTFVRRALLPFVDDVQIATTSTGALGTVGNKGGVGISLKVHMTSICIITAHLAAGQSQVNKRNEDIATILASMDFNAARRQLVLNGGMIDVNDIVPTKGPKDHDIVIVAGDLNYRVDTTYENGVALANKGDISALLKDDQLVKEMKTPHSPWSEFTDLVPTFRPTYRFDIGTDRYDTSEKQRIPAFTDRILYWTKRKELGSRIEQHKFQSLPEVMSSDHKPVQLIATIPVRTLEPQKQASVVDTLRKTVSSLGLDRVATAKTLVSVNMLDFGVQEFHHCHAQRTLIVTNQGECTASLRVFRQETEASAGVWLRASPSSLSILPGQSAEVTVECVLDKQGLHWVPLWLPFRGQANVRLKSMLVLHVFGGPVHMVECTTEVQPSVFGNSLDNVVRLENLSCMDAYALPSSPETASKHVMRPRLPKELWYMCDAIFKRGLKFPGLFTESGSREACAEIMSFIDRNNKPLPEEAPIDAVGSCLLIFLGSLQQSIVPASLYGAALSAIRSGGKSPLMFIQQQMPPLHANVFLYVVSLMNLMLRPVNTQVNELNPQTVAQVLAQVLMPRPPETVKEGMTMLQYRQVVQQDHDDAIKFMLYFLTPPPPNMQ